MQNLQRSDYFITRRDWWLKLSKLSEDRKEHILNCSFNHCHSLLRTNKLAQLVYDLSGVAMVLGTANYRCLFRCDFQP